MRALAFPRTPSDGRDYQLRIAPSGLLCLLVSDPAAEAASCVFQFAVGSHDEPSQWPGLAHLLEHMLFMGSEAYPEAGSFPRLVSEWSGRFNASTAPERTRYHFSVSPAGLEACLVQLTDMLVAPLFTPEAVAAERQVIDAEFHTRLGDPALHEQAALAQAFHPAHPLSRFSAGNLTSLGGPVPDLVQALHQFHRHFYQAGSGCLVLHAARPMTELEMLSSRAAARLPAGASPARKNTAPLMDQSALPALLYWQSPGAKTSQLVLFALDGLHSTHGARALRWLCEWLASPAPAGGLGWLRSRGLAAQLQACTQRYAGQQTLLRIDIEPLEEADYAALLDGLFAWLAALRATPIRHWPQEARQRLADQAFNAGPQGEPLRWLTALAERVLYEPPEQILESTGQWAGLDEDAWLDLLSQLTPARVLLAQSQPGDAGLPQREPWTDTPVAYGPLRWQAHEHASDGLPAAGWPVWSLDPPERAARPTAEPVATPHWLEIPAPCPPAHAGGQGMDSTRFAWCWPAGQLGREQRDRLQARWELQLEPLGNWMSASGLRVHWQGAPGMISLEMGGPTEALLSGAAAALAALNDEPDAALQRLAEHRYQAGLRERRQALPAYRLLDELDGLLHPEPSGPNPADRPQIAWLYPDAWGYEQREPVITALDRMNAQHHGSSRWQPSEARRLGQGTERIEAECLHADRAQILYCQAAADGVVDRACWQLLHQHISASFFDQLRTRQQLGYWVVARYHEVAGVPGLILLVQSPSHDHDQIASALSAWLDAEQARLWALPFEQVQSQARRLAEHLRTQTATAPGRIEQAWAQALGLPAATRGSQCDALEQLTVDQWQQTQGDCLREPRRLWLFSRSA